MAKAAVLKGIKCGCFGLGPAPFSCWFVSLAAKRKSGWGICGSLICGVVLFGCDLNCLYFGAGQLCYVPSFLHRLCIYQDRATEHYGQTRGKKNPLLFFGTVSAFCLPSPSFPALPWPCLMRVTSPVVAPGPLPQAMVAR